MNRPPPSLASKLLSPSVCPYYHDISPYYHGVVAHGFTTKRNQVASSVTMDSGKHRSSASGMRNLALMLCLSADVRPEKRIACAASYPFGPDSSRAHGEKGQFGSRTVNPRRKDLTTIKHTERLFQEGNPHLQLGGLPSGSGFAIGPVFQWSNPTDGYELVFSRWVPFRSTTALVLD